MKKCFAMLVLFATVFVANVWAESAPIADGGWEWNENRTLNGRQFGYFQVAESYREQDGWAYINGFGKIHYWLYDTYTYHNGDGLAITDYFVPSWIESMGYVIDFDNMRRINPNDDLASSVKALMTQRGCDVSVALIRSVSEPYVVINNYDSVYDSYWTDIIPLIK